MDGGGKESDVRLGLLDHFAKFLAGSERRVAQPVVAHHAPLVGVGNRPGFQRLHIRKGLPGLLRHRVKKIVAKTETADVQGETEVFVTEEVRLIAIPERGCVHMWKQIEVENRPKEKPKLPAPRNNREPRSFPHRRRALSSPSNSAPLHCIARLHPNDLSA